MIDIDKIVSNNYKKVVVIGSLRSNDDSYNELKKVLKDTEIVYYDDFLFLPNAKQSSWNLPDNILLKIEEVKALEVDALIITSKRFSNKLARRISELCELEFYYEKETNTSGPIVVIDSGIGGLTVASKINKLLPVEDITVIADTEFLPYGNKKEIIISRRASQIIKHVKALNPKVVVLACNTLDSIAKDKIKAQLGGIELISIISNTAKEAVKNKIEGDIALIATPNTIQSQRYMTDLLKYSSSKNLIGLECENLASSIEHNENIKEVFNEELKPLLDYKFNTLILGCTHYTKVKPLVSKMFKDVTIIDSVEVVVNKTNEYIEINNIKSKAKSTEINIEVTKELEEFSNNIKKAFQDIKYNIKYLELK